MCGIEKGKESYYKNRVNGLSPYCKPCAAERKRAGNLSREELLRRVYPTAATKVCSKCGKEKLRTEFNGRVHHGKPALRSMCRGCQAAGFKRWAIDTGHQTWASREELRMAKRLVTYPSDNMKLCRSCDRLLPMEEFGHRFHVGGICKECRNVQEKEMRSRNPDAHREYAKNYRQNNLEAVRKYARDGARRRNENLKNARSTSRLTDGDKWKFVAAHGYKCMCCGVEEKITFDHIVPISKGGADSIDNIQLLCAPCNSSKGTRVIDYRSRA